MKMSAWVVAFVCVLCTSKSDPALALKTGDYAAQLGPSYRNDAIERGNFQNLLFDNRVLWNHRALAAVFGVVLRLPTH